MNLRLKYPPVPANASRFADDIVEIAQDASGVRLDFTPKSLEDLDDVVQSFADDGAEVEDVKETLFGFGCYVGEVFVRHAGGRWRAAQPGEEASFGWPIVVQLGSGDVCNPIGKVFKRLELGESENLRYFYDVFAGGKTAPPARRGGLLSRLFKRGE
jgi:hypothetical protein